MTVDISSVGTSQVLDDEIPIVNRERSVIAADGAKVDLHRDAAAASDNEGIVIDRCVLNRFAAGGWSTKEPNVVANSMTAIAVGKER